MKDQNSLRLIQGTQGLVGSKILDPGPALRRTLLGYKILYVGSNETSKLNQSKTYLDNVLLRFCELFHNFDCFLKSLLCTGVVESFHFIDSRSLQRNEYDREVIQSMTLNYELKGEMQYYGAQGLLCCDKTKKLIQIIVFVLHAHQFKSKLIQRKFWIIGSFFKNQKFSIEVEPKSRMNNTAQQLTCFRVAITADVYWRGKRVRRIDRRIMSPLHSNLPFCGQFKENNLSQFGAEVGVLCTPERPWPFKERKLLLAKFFSGSSILMKRPIFVWMQCGFDMTVAEK